MDEKSKLINYNSCKYLTYFVLDVIRAPEVGYKKYPPPENIFALVHEAVVVTPIPDLFRAKPQPKRRAQTPTRHNISNICGFKWGSKWKSQ